MNTRSLFFFGLNAVRALSIVSLILVFASSILVMVTNIKAVNAFQAAQQNSNSTDDEYMDCDYIEGSTVPNQAAGVFWAVVSSLLILFQSIILILSECSWPMSFFDRFFPVLGSDFGLGALGIFQGLIGAQILSHHVDDFSLVAGFFVFSIGCLNMILGLIFRQSTKTRRSIRGWRSDNADVLPKTVERRPTFVSATPATFVAPAFTGSTEKSGVSTSSGFMSEKSGYGFGRQGEKAAGLRGFILKTPEETLPRYASPHPPRSNRSSTSSFASPMARRASIGNDRDIEERRASSGSARGESPPPKFKSSTTAL